MKLHNENNDTVLHIACQVNSQEVFRLFLDLFDEQYDNLDLSTRKDRKKRWVNMQNNKGLTALHIACYFGNLEMIKLLDELGADPHLRCLSGHSIYHMAVEYDHIIPLFYYKDRVSLDIQNDFLATPQIYAVDQTSDTSAYFLISLGADQDKLDINGYSAQHWAANNGNTRMVRRLRQRDCNIKLKNNEEQTAIDIANNKQYVNTLSELKDECLLRKYFTLVGASEINRGCWRQLFTQFTFIQIGCKGFFVVVQLFPCKPAWIVFTAVFGLQVLTFFMSWIVHPGYIKHKTGREAILRDMHSVETYKICPDCQIIKPARSRHCDICKRCVSVYDHHCPYIDNCVGARNLKFFIPFIISYDAVLLMIAVFDIFAICNDKASGYDLLGINDFVNKNLIQVKIAIGILGTLSLFCGIMLMRLVLTQLVNIFKGQTTFERYGYHQKLNSQHQQSQEHSTSQDRSSTNTVSIIGSSLSADHPREYEHIKKGCLQSSCDMLCKNGVSNQFNDSHYTLLNNKSVKQSMNRKKQT